MVQLTGNPLGQSLLQSRSRSLYTLPSAKITSRLASSAHTSVWVSFALTIVPKELRTTIRAISKIRIFITTSINVAICENYATLLAAMETTIDDPIDAQTSKAFVSSSTNTHTPIVPELGDIRIWTLTGYNAKVFLPLAKVQVDAGERGLATINERYRSIDNEVPSNPLIVDSLYQVQSRTSIFRFCALSLAGRCRNGPKCQPSMSSPEAGLSCRLPGFQSNPFGCWSVERWATIRNTAISPATPWAVQG